MRHCPPGREVAHCLDRRLGYRRRRLDCQALRLPHRSTCRQAQLRVVGQVRPSWCGGRSGTRSRCSDGSAPDGHTETLVIWREGKHDSVFGSKRIACKAVWQRSCAFWNQHAQRQHAIRENRKAEGNVHSLHNCCMVESLSSHLVDSREIPQTRVSKTQQLGRTTHVAVYNRRVRSAIALEHAMKK